MTSANEEDDMIVLDFFLGVNVAWGIKQEVLHWDLFLWFNWPLLGLLLLLLQNQYQIPTIKPQGKQQVAVAAASPRQEAKEDKETKQRKKTEGHEITYTWYNIYVENVQSSQYSYRKMAITVKDTATFCNSWQNAYVFLTSRVWCQCEVDQ